MVPAMHRWCARDQVGSELNMTCNHPCCVALILVCMSHGCTGAVIFSTKTSNEVAVVCLVHGELAYAHGSAHCRLQRQPTAWQPSPGAWWSSMSRTTCAPPTAGQQTRRTQRPAALLGAAHAGVCC